MKIDVEISPPPHLMRLGDVRIGEPGVLPKNEPRQRVNRSNL
jgi:hypothetical protein